MRGPQEERHLSGKYNHYFSVILAIAYKNHKLLEVGKHFEYASLSGFGNSTRERIQFGGKGTPPHSLQNGWHKKPSVIFL